MKCFRYLAVVATVILSACTHLQPAKPVEDWQAHREQIAALDYWQITGKLGLRLPGENASANLRWRQQEAQFRIDLSGPFGQGRVLISGDETQATLEQPGQAPISAANAEDLLWQASGWVLPVDHLIYWVRGIPAPYTRATGSTYDEGGRLAGLHQAGWTLNYSQYGQHGLYRLPGRIIAERDDIRLTLVIRQWDLSRP